MSFFRFLLALLISAGIAYGLYLAVDERRLERAVEAVRTEIIAPAVDAVQGGTSAEGETEEDASAEADIATDEAPADDAPTGEVSEADTGSDALADSTDDGSEMADASDESAETPATNFAARVEEDAARADADAPVVEDRATETTASVQLEAADTADTIGENDLPRIAAMPAPPEAILPDDAQAPAAMEAQEPLPTAIIADDADEGGATDTTDAADTPEATRTTDATETANATGTATAALGIVNSGMNYVEARETLIGAGWSPRLPATRTGGPNDAENAMIEAGYGELEGCNDADRPICRFEFVDGEKRIAAILTAGSGTDPSVIDAFLMNIRAE